MERIVASTGGGTIKLGRRGENEAREIVFNISRWTRQYGAAGTVALVHRRSGDENPYPCEINIEKDSVVWRIKSADTDHEGVGECELFYLIGTTIVKSVIWSTFVGRSITDDTSAEVPNPEQSWVDQVIAASTGRSAYEVAVERGFEGSVDEWLLSLVGPEGQQGYTPQRGVDYWTPEDVATIDKHIDEQFEGVNEAIEAILDIQNEILGIITFTIDGTLYKADKGMYWYEWVDSKYDTLNAKIEPGTDYVYYTPTGARYPSYIMLNRKYVDGMSTIINKAKYSG